MIKGKKRGHFLISVLRHISLRRNTVFADKGYNSQSIMDYIHEHGGNFIISLKSNSKEKRECD